MVTWPWYSRNKLQWEEKSKYCMKMNTEDYYVPV